MVRKRKKKTPRQIITKKLDDLWKLTVKERDDWTCQYCGEKVEGANCHASHVIPRSAGNRVKWSLLNGKVLCYHHHINWWHKSPCESGAWFKEKFPERWAYLREEKAKGTIKFTQSDLEDMYEEMKNG